MTTCIASLDNATGVTVVAVARAPALTAFKQRLLDSGFRGLQWIR